jgi:hypothetical protein
MVVAWGAPGGAWQITLDESSDSYVVTLRSPAYHGAQLVVRLPRRTIDDAVLAAAGITLELTPEGRVAAYGEGSSGRTLAATALSTLIAEAVAPGSLSAEDGQAVLGRLEAELVRALEVVRRARGS